MKERGCPHTVILLGNRDLGSGKGVCVECVTMVPVDIRSPDLVPVFAAVRRPSPRSETTEDR